MQRIAKWFNTVARSAVWLGALVVAALAARGSDFVSTTGTNFMLAGQTFRFSGANNYYLIYKSNRMVDDVLTNAVAMNLKVIRAWGFLDGASKDGKVTQPSLGVYDPSGFERVDYFVFRARQLGLKLIIPFVNNWDDFGGMNWYVAQTGGGAHEDFYTRATIKTAYRNYVSHFLNRTNQYTGIRYTEEPAIFAWELANEPRSTDATGNTLLGWAGEMSAFIQSLDTNHLVCLGDEGFYNQPANSDWTMNGSQGVDWLRLLQLPGIDFGTVHLYPDHWSKTAEWGANWIAQHIRDGHALGKPVLLEEYGYQAKPARDSVYAQWTQTVENEGGSGDLFWILTGMQDDGSPYPDYDGFDVKYPSTTATVLANHATMMLAQSGFTPAPVLSVSDASVSQPATGTTNLTFAVTLTPAVTNTVNVNFATSDNTAVAGTDYLATNGTLNFPPGVTSRTVTVTVLGGSITSGSKTFAVHLADATNAMLGMALGIGTIVGPTVPPPPPAAGVTVGFHVDNDWGSGANVTITITNATTNAITNWTLEFDYAATILPYSHATVVAHVGAHQVFTNLSYAVIPANGTLAFQCGATPGNLGTNQPANYVLNGASAGGGGSNGAWPALTVGDAEMNEGNAGFASLAIPLTLNAAPTQEVTVAYSTAGITAAAGTDFLATNGVLAFVTGQTQQWIHVTVIGDSDEEADETLAVTLTNPTNATLARATATATLRNDDIVLRLSVNDASVFEGNNGLTPAAFVLSLNTTSASPVIVSVSTADVTAVAGVDYLATNLTVNFSPGQFTQTVTVYVLGNTNQQLARTFALNLASPVGAVIQDAQGLGTILDDDGGFNGKPPTGAFNYAEALQKSLFFFECQRAGPLPPGNRVTWRGDAATADGSDVGRDLTGGWFDAGDHVKFGLPMAASATLLAWGGIEYSNAFVQTGQWPCLLDNLKWVCDYFLKCHVVDPNGDTLEFYGQVGNGSTDHAFWGPPEVMTMPRPSYKVTRTAPGSDLAGETAAALAASAMLFQSVNPAYASNLLANARKLYQFADTFRGKYSDTITDAQGFYNSWSGYQDELLWGALWLYRATGETNYLVKAQAVYNTLFAGNWGEANYPTLKWTHAWDDKTYGSLVLLSMLTTNAAYRTNAQRWLDYWTVGRTDGRITYTPGGLAYLDQWGSLRYAANTAFLALLYSDKVGDVTNRYRNFAVAQINYALGANPSNRSFVCGFGTNPPVNPHHRGAHGSWNNSINTPVNTRHVLYGALVGGPGSTDNYTDTRDNYVNNEVACDYNAAFTGALARLYEVFGGYTQPGFPTMETPTNQFFVEASINQSGSFFTEIRALLNNRSAWPATASTNLRYRYFVDLSELYAAGGTTNNVTITVNMLDGGSISGLLPWDPSRRIYYVELRYDGVNIIPGGSTSYRREAQFRLTIPNTFPSSAWNPANDWSYAGLLVGNANVTNTGRLPAYRSGVLAEGAEPPSPGGYQTWRGTNFTTAELANPAVSGDSADADGDGLPTLLEYALGLNPKAVEPALAPTLQFESISGQRVPTLICTQNTSATDVTPILMESSDLGSWKAAVVQELTRTSNNGRDTLKFRLYPAGQTPERLFLRWQVSRTQ